MKLHYIIFLSFFTTVSFADSNDNWIEPTSSDLVGDQSWRSSSKNRFLNSEADFDGDGKSDFVEIVVNISIKKMGLRVTLSHAKQKVFILDELPLKYLEVMGVGSVEPGKYLTACGKGYFECSVERDEYATLTAPAIDYFQYEGANSLFIWNRENGLFERIWMSD